jgi:hypothetical protein
MKWKSTLFTELSNKLGDQIVGARWKGRGYFRSYIIPANPDTLKQKANRAHTATIVGRWGSTIKVNPDYVAAWNKASLPRLISGFNLMMKRGRRSSVACPATKTGAYPQTIAITYTVKTDLGFSKMLRYIGATVLDVTPAGGLQSGDDQTFNDTLPAAGTYVYMLYSTDVLKSGDTAPKTYQGHNRHSLDYTTGTIKLAQCVSTA